MIDISVECKKAQEIISDIEKGFTNSDSIIQKAFMQKGDVVRLLASSYETLVINGIIEIEIENIATYLMKRLKSLNADITKVWIYEALPAKYKSHSLHYTSEEDTYHQSTEFTVNSSLYTNYEEQNKSELDYWQDQIILCKKIISHLKTESYIEKTDEKGIPLLDLLEYESDLIIRKTAQNFVSETFDNRKTVSVNTIHILLEAFSLASNKYAAGMYVSKLKEFGIQKKHQSLNILQKLFTAKQLGKILKGETKEVHQSFQIITEEDAYENGFYGKAKCQECGDYRVKLVEKYDYAAGKFRPPILHCFACLKATPPPRVKLPMAQPTPNFG